MIRALQQILEGALARLSSLVMSYLPAVLAGLVILVVALLMAFLVRWVLTRIFKGVGVDRFLRQSGLVSLLAGSGQPRAARVVAGAAFWAILLAGALMALSVFDSRLTTRLTESVVLVVPKLVIAGLILVCGLWLAQWLGRSVLVWAFNENLPQPRRLALAVRLVVILAAAATAADQLDFGRHVFLAAFILLVGAVALAGGLAAGLCGRDALRRHLERPQTRSEEPGERSLWTHL